MLLDSLLNVVRALTGSELDDPNIGETVDVERIFRDDGFNLPSTGGDCEDDSAIPLSMNAASSRNLSAAADARRINQVRPNSAQGPHCGVTR